MASGRSRARTISSSKPPVDDRPYYEPEFRFLSTSRGWYSLPGVMEEQMRALRVDAAANRVRILEAARDAFARRGLDAEIREVAELAGVGVGTIYRHFGSREGLLAALKAQSKERLLQTLRLAVESDDPVLGVRLMIGAGADAYERFGALTEALIRGELAGSDTTRSDAVELLARVLQTGIEKGAFRPDLDVHVAAAVLEAIFTSGVLLQLAAARSFREAGDEVADFFLAAIQPPAGTGG